MSFAATLEQEMVEFRLSIISRVCATRGIRVTRDDCESALIVGKGKLSSAVSHICESRKSKWGIISIVTTFRRVFGRK
jgi:hypothetical protein